MQDIDWYNIVRALHLIAVISWMAGLFYLPRLYIYHVEADPGSDKSETFKIMERRLLRAIMNPAMIATWIFGIYLLMEGEWLIGGGGWIHLKLLCVVLLTVFHMACARWRKQFEADENRHTAKFFRFMNEVPTVLMIIIVVMAVVKPF